MDTRREFLRKVMMLSGAAGMSGLAPESVSRAMAINPEPGSTYLDAEHIVILMQENRSFDHCFGTLQGVRGFNDPRRIDLPNGNPVWLQSNAQGETFAPFRLDMHGTKATWMGSTPHSRQSQIDACNGGRYDRWLDAKQVGNKAYAHLPLTMGYYRREDIPFNYALADAFTVCDQNFCSAMTSTWPNRLFLWSGAIRGEQNGDAKAYIRNNIPYGEAHWTTFPELLERNHISWQVYQNDISAGGGFVGEERAWLSNFGCNLLEWFAQFNVRFSSRYVDGLRKQAEELPKEIQKLHEQMADPAVDFQQTAKLARQISAKEKVLADARDGLITWSRENFEKLSPEARSLHARAFAANSDDPDYHQLTTFDYEENGERRELNLPKGDVLHQFRKDVNSGKLPMVSWLVGPEKFSDHPTAPWFGSWYVSEVLDILTKNPEVWKKTIFILTYDENDGYFDHVPPYVAPDPRRPETGRCSEGIDPAVEYITLENELRDGVSEKEARGGPVGLGFRVPMIIASPWTRGGRVCSHVFDHTSVFRFVQDFINKKTGSQIQETNTSLWRKTVSGHLGMVFRPYQGNGKEELSMLDKQPFIKGIFNAKFKDIPANSKMLSEAEVAGGAAGAEASSVIPRQEPGVRPSCALPYQLHADGGLSDDRKSFAIKLEARKEVFGDAASGSPFNVFIPAKYAVADKEGNVLAFEHVGYRSYAVKAGDHLVESFPLQSFEGGTYHLRIDGPNGFHREYKGEAAEPPLKITCDYDRDAAEPNKLTGKLRFLIHHLGGNQPVSLEIRDHAYGKALLKREVPATTTPDKAVVIVLDQSGSHGWYDVGISVPGFDNFIRRYAGRIETGQDGFTDPCMGQMA
ncbi:phospholipase C, phosphocholine-specific [Roseimicrobium sp. ORNL1]|uniref:phosphocholine-specific phospholipase C n=1 Tax=Roseimicrobium sp. ORNL1 TaxID=2711231 RepID=UPI0013E106E7|nr:phospholipase C, phosphocholine-specific [Roseimicrobium sp. ORNL1]QIF02173.1 phospholipase C, phosphocholine-specific [Roseimicrobium sp. ORNL1]